jgi:Tfp pilus assembly protein PilO
MDTDELKERYKSLPMWARLLIALGVGLLPGAYIYFDEGELLAASLDEANQEKEAAQAKLDHAIAKKKKIPQIEERLAELEEQLAKAKKALPNSFRVEDVLQKTATIAKETGVKLVLFNPEQQKPGRGEYRYMELPIATEIDGKFNQIAAFFDRLVHLEHSLFIRNLDISAVVEEVARDSVSSGSKSEHQLAMEARQRLSAKGKFQIIVYRSMTDPEIAAADAAASLDGAADGGAQVNQSRNEAEAGAAPPAAGGGQEAGGGG